MNPKEQLSIPCYKGSVKKVIIKSYDFDEEINAYQENPGEITTIIYDKKGDCTTYIVKYGTVINPTIWGADFDDYRYEYVYNEKGFLLKKNKFDENDALEEAVYYEYDNKGNVVCVKRISRNLSEYIFYNSYEEGSDTKKVISQNKDFRNERLVQYDGEKRVLLDEKRNSLGVVTMRQKYDYTSMGMVSEMSYYNQQGKREHYTITTHDLKGRMLERTSYTGEGSVKSRMTREYIDNVVIQTSYNSDNTIKFKYKHTYGENDEIKESIKYDALSVVIKHTRFDAVYDEFGNIIYSEIWDVLKNRGDHKTIYIFEYYT